MKEFLTRHEVPFVSVNVIEDARGYAQLADLGVRSVPIVARGRDWANGQVLADVARVAGIRLDEHNLLPPAELYRRLMIIQCVAQRLFAQIPEARVGEHLPQRPRSYAGLAFHIFHIAELFVDHIVKDRVLVEGDYDRKPRARRDGKGHVRAFGREVQTRLHTWWADGGKSSDFQVPAKVYYGRQSVHEFLERTTWHSGQHVRQLCLVLEHLGIVPDRPPGAELWDGLPMPEKVWEDDVPWTQ